MNTFRRSWPAAFPAVYGAMRWMSSSICWRGEPVPIEGGPIARNWMERVFYRGDVKSR